MDAPYQSAGTFFSEATTKSTARRLRRTRQHLGSYRHDLLVAMRIVNNVEREILRAEWENWLLDENTRCKQVQRILREEGTNVSPTRRIKGADPEIVLDRKAKERMGNMDNLLRWQKEYCGSCQRELELLFASRSAIIR